MIRRLALLLLAFHSAPALADRYEVIISQTELRIEGRTQGPVSVTREGKPYLRNVQIEKNGRWVPFHHWSSPGPKHLRYRFLLRRAAQGLDDRSSVEQLEGNVILTCPSSWLLSPVHTVQVHVRSDHNQKFACTVAATAPDTYPISTGHNEPFCAFGPLRLRQHTVGSSTVLEAATRLPNMEPKVLDSWIARTAGAVGRYFGRFPVRHLLVLVVPSRGSHLGGTTYGIGGALILLQIPRDRPAKSIVSSWELCHEMVHLSLPNLPQRYHWFEEGLASYVEPLIRRQEGWISGAKVWKDFREGMPRGARAVQQSGLDHNHSWAATYWGGALYCLLVDVRLRTASNNRQSLQSMLRALVQSGNNITGRAEFSSLLRLADRLTNSQTFTQVHQEIGKQPGTVNLPELWRSLATEKRAVRDGIAPLP